MALKVKKPEKTTWRFGLDCTHPAEDGVFDSANSEQLLREKVQVGGETGNLGRASYNACFANKITVVSETQFSERCLKCLTEKYLQKSSPHAWPRGVAPDEETRELCHFQTGRDEHGSRFEGQGTPAVTGLCLLINKWSAQEKHLVMDL
ncbi:60S ribosomal protein L22-like 1 [Phyllostomus discolor]|uniref:60S ribosomal protein L22-like 1 n=1 Tax=Phyllostomus discolor TaxID=89673 RepID=A0A7E6EFG4_9CHIR|nr:60S ribosomal protein L22-like 1 [Phyllostomus discolor]